jgi:hypothetical protein
VTSGDRLPVAPLASWMPVELETEPGVWRVAETAGEFARLFASVPGRLVAVRWNQ